MKKFFKKLFNLPERGTWKAYGLGGVPALREMGTGRVVIEKCPASYQEHLVRLLEYVPIDVPGYFMDHAGNHYYQ